MYPSELGKASRRTPRMDRQVDRIIKILGDSPMTVPQLADALFISRHTAGNYIRLMYNATPKRIHVSGWLPTDANKPTRIYSVGDHRDAKYVTKRQKTGYTKTNNMKAELLDLLALPQTVNQLAERYGISQSRTRDLVAMLKKEGRVHIKAWALPEYRGSQAPMYAVGNEPDAVRERRTRQKAKRSATRTSLQKAKHITSGIFAALGL